MLTAIILVGVQRPTVITEPVVQTAPIEIELVTLPDQLESTMAAGTESAKSRESEEGTTGEELESSFESVTEIEESEAIEPEVIASNSKTIEKDIAAESLKTDVVEEVIVDTETSTAEDLNSEIVNSEIVNSEAVESEVVVPETNESATELELLSGATATVATTIKKSDNATGNAGKGVDGEALNEKGLNKKGLGKEGSSKGDDAAPIVGGYTGFSAAPQSPSIGNIITNNSNKNSTYQKSVTERKIKQGVSKGDSSRSLVSIIPALPFEHELVDSDYAITEEDWLIAPRFTVTHLEQYQLDSDNNDNNNNNSENENITVYFSLSINAKGRIKEITTIRSSGSNRLDQIIKEDLMKARLKAFDKNGKSLAGIATITLEIDSN